MKVVLIISSSIDVTTDYIIKEYSSTANKMAREFLKEKLTTLEHKLMLIGGKKFIKTYNQWVKREYGIKSCSLNILIKMCKKEYLDSEFTEVLERLVECVK